MSECAATNPDVIIWVGDVLAALALMDDESVDMVVTSPPYWGLRDYGTGGWEDGDPDCSHDRVDTMRTPWANAVKGPGGGGKNGTTYANHTKVVGGRCAKCEARWVDCQIGMEATLAEHIEVLVEVFDEVRRVMKSEATLWLNYGDCYASSVNGRSAADTKLQSDDDRTFRDKPFSTVGPVDLNSPDGPRLKPKDLCMAANRLAIALQDAGWWVRSEIIWHKTNPMPESVTDRPATSHEKLFLLTKSERYYYDAEAVREEAVAGTQARYERGRSETHKYADGGPGKQTIAKTFNHMRKHPSESNTAARPPGHYPQSGLVAADENPTGTRNLRNVWTIPTAPFPGAHFATFPPALVEPCIKAGCPNGGVVLDPFGGAGTVAMVASRLQRRAVLIELNPDYADIAEKRIRADTGSMFHTLERRDVVTFEQPQWEISEAGKGID